MAQAKRKIVLKKKEGTKKNPVKKLTEEELAKIQEEQDKIDAKKAEEEAKKEEENAGTTGNENNPSEGQWPEEDEVQGDVERKARNIIWDIGGSVIVKPQWRIRFEAQVAPVPMFKLPEDIRRYLQTHWLTSDVYKRDKEWLEKHNVDMEMVEKLKRFLTEKL